MGQLRACGLLEQGLACCSCTACCGMLLQRSTAVFRDSAEIPVPGDALPTAPGPGCARGCQEELYVFGFSSFMQGFSLHGRARILLAAGWDG